MRFLDNLGIGVKLPFLTVLVGVVSLLLVELIATAHSNAAILNSGRERLLAVAASRAEELEREFDGILRDLDARTRDPVLREATRALVTAWALAEQPGGPDLRRLYSDENPYPLPLRDRLVQADDQSSYSLVHRRFHPFFSRLLEGRGYADIYLASPTGTVVYSSRKDASFGVSLDGAASSLAAAFEWGRAAAAGVYYSGFHEVADAGGARSALFAAPVRSPRATLEGVLIIRVDSDHVTGIIGRELGLGKAGRAAMVAGDGTLISGSPDIAAMTVTGAQEGMRIVVDDTNVVAHVPVDILGRSHVLLAAQPTSEILAPALAARDDMLRDGIVALCIVTIVGLFMARSISVPLVRVGDAMDRVARKDYESEIEDCHRGDEIGWIARRLDHFRASLVEAEGFSRETAFKGAAFEASSSALMLLDSKLMILHLNERAIELFRDFRIPLTRLVPDFRPDGMQGRSVATLFPGAERCQAILRDSSRVSDRIKLGQFHLRLDMGAVRDDANVIIGYVLEWTDVTIEHTDRVVLRTIDQHMPTATFSPDGRLVGCNDLFTEWALDRSEETGSHWSEIFGGGPEDRWDWAEISGPAADGAVICLRARSGCALQATVHAVRDDNGRAQRHVVLAFSGRASAMASFPPDQKTA